MAKELDKKPEDISTFVKMFNGKQINECFLGHLARHPMVFIAKMFEYHITTEGWNAALEFAREGVERDFKCPNLIDIEQMRPERVKEAYIDSLKGRQVSTKNKEMDAFEVLVGLASKGLIVIESDDYLVVIDPRSPVDWGLLGKGTNTFDAKVRIARLSDGPRPEFVLELDLGGSPISTTNKGEH